MPRKRTVPDEALLAAALSIVRASGPDALSFGSLAARVDLAASTLVQRFGSRADLLRAALLLAWDRLDEQTARACAEAPSGAAGVVDLLVRLSGQYDAVDTAGSDGADGADGDRDADEYADQLMLLREDLRDPVLRARGQAWLDTLAAAVEERLADVGGGIPGGVRGLGELVVSQWQGSLTVWGFRRRPDVVTAVRRSLENLLARISPEP
ncbi:TetR family transcriptional regulator [Actinopolymorpha sp. NPDC004070]|uniref:TetR family transcriptional regulator n=1 Tax=Actinopolymorpha sp. NPDC004070 TaxID=3154548 RepID=UPI0033BC0537